MEAKENKILIVQNADHVQSMTVYAIERLHLEAANCAEPATISEVCAKARKMGLYEVAKDLLREFKQGTKDFKTQWHERESAIPGYFDRHNIMNTF